RCNLQPCASTAYRPWSQWAACSKSCGGGQQKRSKMCVLAMCTPLMVTESRVCNAAACSGRDPPPRGLWLSCGGVPCDLGVVFHPRECPPKLCVGRG
ncbi:MAG: hypothetical protein GY832_00750, partial [Chloroflexi bacterium]|nr:hypothetical protein [Chloroflexota bacterium]